MQCPQCPNSIPDSWVRCPHCGEPGHFPNVRAAQAESQVLDSRYKKAISTIEPRVLDEFEQALASSHCVLNRSFYDTMRLATSDNALYNTYYQQIESEYRIPENSQWDAIRAVMDERLFPNYRRDIRFAALSLDHVGLSHYGDCSITLNTSMVCHRASAFHENSARWVARYLGLSNLPTGYRAIWAERLKLAIAKLANQLFPNTTAHSFSKLLLKEEPGGNDEFIEIHIWGPMTRRTFSLVIVSRDMVIKYPEIVEALMLKLAEAHVPLGVQL